MCTNISFDRITISGELYAPPEEEIITDYLKQNNKEWCNHCEVGIDMYNLWKNMLDSEYITYTSDDKLRTITILENMDIIDIIFYLSFVDGDENKPKIDIFEEKQTEYGKECNIQLNYWPTY